MTRARQTRLRAVDSVGSGSSTEDVEERTDSMRAPLHGDPTRRLVLWLRPHRALAAASGERRAQPPVGASDEPESCVPPLEVPASGW